MVLEILNLKVILLVLNKLPANFVPLTINFASDAMPFTFAAAKCIAVIIFTFRSAFHYSFQLMIVSTFYLLMVSMNLFQRVDLYPIHLNLDILLQSLQLLPLES